MPHWTYQPTSIRTNATTTGLYFAEDYLSDAIDGVFNTILLEKPIFIAPTLVGGVEEFL
jgi:hypothetical protein